MVLEVIHMLTGISNPEMPQNLHRIKTKNFYATFSDISYLVLHRNLLQSSLMAMSVSFGWICPILMKGKCCLNPIQWMGGFLYLKQRFISIHLKWHWNRRTSSSEKTSKFHYLQTRWHVVGQEDCRRLSGKMSNRLSDNWNVGHQSFCCTFCFV